MSNLTVHITLKKATLSDYPMIQNMARFYVYDLSKECGFLSDEWNIPPDGLFESFDFKPYFEKDSCCAYLIKVREDIAGFVLINQETICKTSHWNMVEFFVLGKYQGKGVGIQAAERVWQNHPGLWEVLLIPENHSALIFWESAINKCTHGNFTKKVIQIDFDKTQPKRVIFTFDTTNRVTSL